MGEDKTVGMPLSDFVLQLEDYTPTVRYDHQTHIFVTYLALLLLSIKLNRYVINMNISASKYSTTSMIRTICKMYNKFG